MAAALQFLTTTMRMLSGVLIWATHFGIVHLTTALVYARGFQNSSWLGIGIVAWMVVPAWRSLYRDGPRTATAAFIDWMTVSFGGLALLAILWVTFPVRLVQIC